ncbi:hypothetical protein ACFP6B_10995, partial [Rothia nasimurium]|uniref:hypothetical protein n=1 Tax=Rothia nasimurium TaxID=85336 RepID=UPI0036060EAC
TLIFLPRVGPLSSWWVWGACLLLNKPQGSAESTPLPQAVKPNKVTTPIDKKILRRIMTSQYTQK